MKVTEAYEKIKAEVENALPLFDGIKVNVSVENEICDGNLDTIEDISRAKSISSTLVIGADGLTEDDNYCLYLGLDVKRGEVKDDEVNKTVSEFRKTLEEVRSTLAVSEDTTKTLLELGKAAEEEFEEVMKQIKKSSRISGIAAALFGIGVLILFLVATFS